MTSPPRDSLQIQQDAEFQERQWRATQIAWVLMLLIMGPTVAGMFEKGQSVPHAPADRMRRSRWSTGGWPLRSFNAAGVHVKPDPDGIIRFSLDEALVRAFRIDAVVPSRAAPGSAMSASSTSSRLRLAIRRR